MDKEKKSLGTIRYAIPMGVDMDDLPQYVILPPDLPPGHYWLTLNKDGEWILDTKRHDMENADAPN
jgi:hypothetical protein